MTQHYCLNSKCTGIRLYIGLDVSDSGDLVECYECSVCHERTSNAAETLVMLEPDTAMMDDLYAEYPPDDPDDVARRRQP